MTGRVDYLGERPDLAAAHKLFGNAMIIALCGGLADVYAMAASLGIDAADAHALFGKFNPAGVLTYRGAAMAKGDYTPTFELTMARKDAGLMIGGGARPRARRLAGDCAADGRAHRAGLRRRRHGRPLGRRGTEEPAALT